MTVSNLIAADWEKEILESKSLVLVSFWHERCPWCKRLEPVYNEVAEEYGDKVKFARLNVLSSNENQGIAVKYGVMSTPTLIFFCDGKPIEGVIGFQPRDHLKSIIDHTIERYRECLEQSTELETG